MKTLEELERQKSIEHFAVAGLSVVASALLAVLAILAAFPRLPDVIRNHWDRRGLGTRLLHSLLDGLTPGLDVTTVHDGIAVRKPGAKETLLVLPNSYAAEILFLLGAGSQTAGDHWQPWRIIPVRNRRALWRIIAQRQNEARQTEENEHRRSEAWKIEYSNRELRRRAGTEHS